MHFFDADVFAVLIERAVVLVFVSHGLKVL
jgi:hypothetical protein